MFGLLPWAVIGLALDREGQRARVLVADRAAGREAAPAIGADFGGRPIMVELVDRAHIGGARQRKVTAIGAVWTLSEILAVDDLGDQAVEVEIALAVAM